MWSAYVWTWVVIWYAHGGMAPSILWYYTFIEFCAFLLLLEFYFILAITGNSTVDVIILTGLFSPTSLSLLWIGFLIYLLYLLFSLTFYFYIYFTDFLEDVDFNPAWIMSEWFTKYSCVFNKRQSGIKNHLLLCCCFRSFLYIVHSVLFSVCASFIVLSFIFYPFIQICNALNRMVVAVAWLSKFKWFW